MGYKFAARTARYDLKLLAALHGDRPRTGRKKANDVAQPLLLHDETHGAHITTHVDRRSNRQNMLDGFKIEWRGRRQPAFPIRVLPGRRRRTGRPQQDPEAVVGREVGLCITGCSGGRL